MWGHTLVSSKMHSPYVEHQTEKLLLEYTDFRSCKLRYSMGLGTPVGCDCQPCTEASNLLCHPRTRIAMFTLKGLDGGWDQWWIMWFNVMLRIWPYLGWNWITGAAWLSGHEVVRWILSLLGLTWSFAGATTSNMASMPWATHVIHSMVQCSLVKLSFVHRRPW